MLRSLLSEQRETTKECRAKCSWRRRSWKRTDGIFFKKNESFSFASFLKTWYYFEYLQSSVPNSITPSEWDHVQHKKLIQYLKGLFLKLSWSLSTSDPHSYLSSTIRSYLQRKGEFHQEMSLSTISHFSLFQCHFFWHVWQSRVFLIQGFRKNYARKNSTSLWHNY
jgi:hypothetical protein